MEAYFHANNIIVDDLASEMAVTGPTGDVVVLNAAGREVFLALYPHGTEEKAANALSERFDIGRRRAARDARKCMAKLRAHGLIVPAFEPVVPRATGEDQWRPEAAFSRRNFAAGVLATLAAALVPREAAHADGGRSASFGHWEESPDGQDWRIWDDPRGFKLKLPEVIERVAPVGAFAHSVMESIDPSMIVNATSWGMRASASPESRAVCDDLSDISGSCLCDYVLENEKPDVVLSIIPEENPLSQNEVLAKNDSGVPIIHMIVGADSLGDAYRTLADLLDRERANEIADYLENMQALLSEFRGSIDPEKTMSVYIGSGQDGLTGTGAGTVLDTVIRSAGAVNALADREGRVDDLTPQEVASLNPDVALVFPGGSSFDRGYMAEQKATWEELASSGCAVVAEPLMPYGWLDRSPLVIYTIGALWLNGVLYPAAGDASMAEIAVEYWDLMFGVNLSEEDIPSTIAEAALALADDKVFKNSQSEDAIESEEEVVQGYEGPAVDAISAQAIAAVATSMSSGGGGGGGSSSSGGGTVGTATNYETEFKKALRNHFGFTESHAALFLDLYSKVKSFFSRSTCDNRNCRIAYTFFRIVGAFVYDSEDGEPSADFMWGLTAGSVSDIYNGKIAAGESVGGAGEQYFFTAVLGVTAAEYKKMRYLVRLQNQASGRTKSEIDSDYSANNNCWEKYKEGFSETGAQPDDFERTWKSLTKAYSCYPDFAHFCITTAAHLATPLGLGGLADALLTIACPDANDQILQDASDEMGGGESLREAFAGWLGDAVLPGSDDRTTFDFPDYWADLDAIAVSGHLASQNYDVLRAMKSRFGSYSGSFSRKSGFLSIHSATRVSRIISSIVYNYSINSIEALSQFLATDVRYEETKWFVDVLRGEVAERGYGEDHPH